MSEEGGQGSRDDEDDNLLAPMPAFVPGGVSQPAGKNITGNASGNCTLIS